MDLFQSFSKQWLHAQLSHHVSLSATNSFWALSMKYVPKLIAMKEQENIKKKVPQFVQVRKNIYKEISPDIHMTFAYLNIDDASIVHVNEEYTPLRDYQRNPTYQKLYEEAHIEVTFFL